MESEASSSFMQGLRALDLTADRFWHGGLVVKTTSGKLELLVGRILLLTPGSRPPSLPRGTLVDSDLVRVVCDEGKLLDLPAFLDAFGRNELPGELRQLLGANVHLPGDATPSASWQFNDRVGPNFSAHALILKRHTGGHVYERIGQGTYERLDDHLKSARPEAFDGVADFVKRVGLMESPFENYMSSPALELNAELCLGIVRFEYSGSDRAYAAEIEAATALPLDRAAVSFMPGAHPRIPLAEAPGVRGGNGRTLFRVLLPGKWSEAPLKASLLYCGRTVSESIATGKKDAAAVAWIRRRATTRDDADVALGERYGRKWRAVASALRRTLSPSMVVVAKARVRDALRLMDSEPFYSVVASGSVVEALLVERLRRIGPRRLAQRAAERGWDLPKITWRDPKLNDCIDIVEKLDLLGGLPVAGLHAVRDARNAIHALVALKRRHGFYVADASAALHLALGLLDVLSGKRSRTLPSARKSRLKRRPAAG